MASYGFYLWHLPVFFAIRFFDPHWNDVVRVIVAVGVTLALTTLSWFLLESPLMRWSKRLETRRFADSPNASTARPQTPASATSTAIGAAEETPGFEPNAETSGVTEHPPP
jgi:peptidoglycan/LPS O-acetylase OafA/YrhL